MNALTAVAVSGAAPPSSPEVVAAEGFHLQSFFTCRRQRQKIKKHGEKTRKTKKGRKGPSQPQRRNTEIDKKKKKEKREIRRHSKERYTEVGNLSGPVDGRAIRVYSHQHRGEAAKAWYCMYCPQKRGAVKPPWRGMA